PSGHGRSGLRAEARDLLEIVDRYDAGQHRTPDAACANAIEKAQIVRVIKEELGDDPVRPRIDLGLQIVDVGLVGRAFGMPLGIASNGDLEIPDALDAGHEIGRTCIAVRVRFVAGADTRRGVAAQSHDVADAY